MRTSRIVSIVASVLYVLGFGGSGGGVFAGDPAVENRDFALENGDLNGDWKRDVSDGVYGLSHLFAGGPEPAPLVCYAGLPSVRNGDSNGNGQVDVSDAIHLFSWLFSGGAAPASACGSGPSGDGQGGITFGEPDGDGHPNVGTIVLDIPPEAPGGARLQMTCSGTLVEPRVFVTAGHCTPLLVLLQDTALAGRIYVSFDSENPLDRTTFVPVAEVRTHPGYDEQFVGAGSIPTDDMGVLILKDPATEPSPANLPPEGFLDGLKREKELEPGPDGTKFTVVGYGVSLVWPPPVVVPRDGVRKATLSAYRALNRSWLVTSQNPATGAGGSAPGDSGGPLFYELSDGTEVLVGIISRGDPAQVELGMNYRVDTDSALGFLHEVIESLEP